MCGCAINGLCDDDTYLHRTTNIAHNLQLVLSGCVVCILSVYVCCVCSIRCVWYVDIYTYSRVDTYVVWRSFSFYFMTVAHFINNLSKWTANFRFISVCCFFDLTNIDASHYYVLYLRIASTYTFPSA